MASTDLSPALPAPAHPMAKSGFGKRTAGDPDAQRPHALADFAHLPPREAYLAAYIDRLPEGAAIDVKTLAKVQPLYGQQAVRSALRELSRTGHLRRVGGVSGGPTVQHVTRTYFSRTARDEAWWAAALELRPSSPPQEAPAAPAAPSVPSAPVERRSEAYDALAGLGQRDHRLVLSAAECAELEPSAAQWLERVEPAAFTQAMTSGLPADVYSPAGLLRARLTRRLPPERSAPPAPRGWRLECTECGVPGEPAALPGGLCRPCREEPDPPAEPVGTLSGDAVRTWTATLRAAAGAHRDRAAADARGD